ncbi:MAG: hypothetical protein ACT4QC_18095 [Planctomycetaceae bacterium]
MSQTQTILEGVVHGKLIELEHEPGLPDGQKVTLSIQPSTAGQALAAGDGIRRSAGSWADDPRGLEQFLDWNRQQRKDGRAELES